jgi:hypothetical protein
VRRIPAWSVLAALVAVSTIVRAWAALRIPTPWIAADEMIYTELGRSLWETGHMSILGADTAFYSLLHPALIGLPLVLFDTEHGYDLARVMQALAMSLAAVPVFAWGRHLMSERWALVAAALTLCIPGLAYSGLLMTETIFYPLVVLSAWLAARALAEPTRLGQALLVGTVALTILTRLQGVVLVPSFVLAVALYAAAGRTTAPLARLWPALAGLAVLGAAVLAAGLGAYEPAGTVSYGLGDALRFGLYHAADLVLLVGVVPACAVVALALTRPEAPAVRAYLAVTFAFTLGFVAQVGLFASRYVGRLAERDLIGLAPLLFLGLGLWLDRGAPRSRLSASLVALGTAGLVLVLPLGRLVHKAALPDAFMLVPVWRLGHYELVVWSFAVVAALAFVLLPRRALAVVPFVLAAVFVASSVVVSRFVADEASMLKTSFFADAQPTWVDDSVDGDVAYFYDGEPHWNAVWSYVFWNQSIRRVYVLEGAKRVPGPLPQTRVEPFPFGELAEDSPPYLVGSTAYSFVGEPLTSVDQSGLIQRGLVLWRTRTPLRLGSVLTGVQGSGDIYGPASLTAYGCDGGRFELTLIAKGSPVTVRLDSGDVLLERTLAPQEIWRPSVPVTESSEVCSLALTPSGLVGSTRFEFVR